MGGILQQESHYEISCLFRWADQLPTVTYSPSPVERSSRMPNASLFIFIFYLLHGFYVLNMSWFRNFTHSPPRFFARTPYVSTLILYARYYSAFTSAFPSSTHTPATFPIHTITVFTTLFIPSLSLTHSLSHLFPLPPLPHQLPIPTSTMGSQYP